MIRKGMFLGVLGGVALALNLAAARPAQAQGNQCVSMTQDLTGQTITNPCNGEVVTLSSGTASATLCANDDKHARISLDIHAMGMGDQGNTYVINFHTNAQATKNAQGLFEENINIELNVISQGSAPNFKEHCNEHVTMTPSGQINLQNNGCTTDCNG